MDYIDEPTDTPGKTLWRPWHLVKDDVCWVIWGESTRALRPASADRSLPTVTVAARALFEEVR